MSDSGDNPDVAFKVSVRWHGIMIIKACVFFAYYFGLEVDNVKLWKTLRRIWAFKMTRVDNGQ